MTVSEFGDSVSNGLLSGGIPAVGLGVHLEVHERIALAHPIEGAEKILDRDGLDVFAGRELLNQVCGKHCVYLLA